MDQAFFCYPPLMSAGGAGGQSKGNVLGERPICANTATDRRVVAHAQIAVFTNLRMDRNTQISHTKCHAPVCISLFIVDKEIVTYSVIKNQKGCKRVLKIRFYTKISFLNEVRELHNMKY